MADTGGGHRSAAVAIGAALQEALDERVSCEIVDILQVSNVPLFRTAHRLYDDLSTRWLRVYDAGFRLTDGMKRVAMIGWFTNQLGRANVVRQLQQSQPHVVVVTHPMTQRFIFSARRATQMTFPIVTVVTDLVSLHSCWTYGDVDLCAVPTDEAAALMLRRGMPAELMVRTGFPVHTKFSSYPSAQAEARRSLGLAGDPFTILVTSGGVGSGRMQKLVVALERACAGHQLLVVTGKNKALYQELTAQPRSRLTHIYGFVDNMEALMAASDIVVTKAGPGTLMEALVMRRPVIVTEAVGVQEHGNIDFVVNHQLGFFCPTIPQILDAVERLSERAHYATTVANLADAVPRDGSVQIAHLVLEQLAQRGTLPAMPAVMAKSAHEC